MAKAFYVYGKKQAAALMVPRKSHAPSRRSDGAAARAQLCRNHLAADAQKFSVNVFGSPLGVPQRELGHVQNFVVKKLDHANVVAQAKYVNRARSNS